MRLILTVGRRIFWCYYIWGPPTLTHTYLSVDFTNPDPVPALLGDLDRYIETIDTIISRKRPQHLRCGPGMYFLNDHPLDKARSGLGWQGWVPFDISTADVPEAAIVLPMQRGTVLASQRDWWIAAGPERNAAAVQRAQALELRLNLMGILPTTIALRRGDRGQGGLRPRQGCLTGVLAKSNACGYRNGQNREMDPDHGRRY